MTPVPDYFQDETSPALRERADWLNEKLGLDDKFLAAILNEQLATVKTWKSRGVSQLPNESEEVLRELWRVVLHLLSFYNNEDEKVRKLIEQSMPQLRNAASIGPPWTGTLRSYFETDRIEAIAKVNEWIMSIKFGSPYKHN